ncbi:peptide chain release factor 2 [Marinilactibacillus psychrotolerans]|uniref:peptide chain release factor 2 n=1 Tax=Marinilactibacillus psychrotolerans TaxID=191770 RepID=UPI00159FDFFE|nr:peptide chain release factor 2 [Marinilactibacillus psychrotolerans]
MEISEIRNALQAASQKVSDFRGLFDLEAMEVDIAEYDEQMSDPSFWNDQQKAQKIIDEANSIKSTYQSFQSLADQVEEYEIMMGMLEEEQDADIRAELEEGVQTLQSDVEAFELEMLLSEPYDNNNAILEIHPGAGGTESQDWGEMLYRMYTRWFDKKGFSYEVLDYQNGEEAGIKSVTLLVKGQHAYGLLKAEKGVHRLVRISPFDSSGRRHTSFVSIDIAPEINEDIDIEINPDDIRVDTYRASGAGGQHINKTESAVRITHKETGLVAASQAGRSQLANKEQAMNMLKAKLYQKELDEKAQQMAAIKGEQKEIGWGSQIRSYVFHPYSMVKDHRTNVESGNTDAVMDGEIDQFIEAYLRSLIQ